MASTSWCQVTGCNDRAAFIIFEGPGKYWPIAEGEIALPPDMNAVCGYHLAMFLRWNPLTLRRRTAPKEPTDK